MTKILQYDRADIISSYISKQPFCREEYARDKVRCRSNRRNDDARECMNNASVQSESKNNKKKKSFENHKAA